MSSITCVSDEGEIMKNITKHKNNKVKISDIVYTALGFSLSNLITELEIMEELTSKDIKGGNYEN